MNVISVIDFMISYELSPSRAEARRLIEQNAVSVDGVKVVDIHATMPTDAQVINVGKRSYSRIAD